MSTQHDQSIMTCPPSGNIGLLGVDLDHLQSTVFPLITPAGINISHSFQMRILLENTTFLLHKIVIIAGIIRVAGIIRGRALYEEIRYVISKDICVLF